MTHGPPDLESVGKFFNWAGSGRRIINGILAGRKGKWGVYLDGTYLNMATDDSQLGPLTVSTRSQLGYFEFGGLYRQGKRGWGEDWQEDKPEKGRRWFLDFLAGGRLTTGDNQFEITCPLAERLVNQSRIWTDPILGLIGITDLTES